MRRTGCTGLLSAGLPVLNGLYTHGDPYQPQKPERRLERHVRPLPLFELADQPRADSGLRREGRDGHAALPSRLPECDREGGGRRRGAAHTKNLVLTPTRFNPFT